MKNKKLSFRSWRVVALCLMCLFGVTQMWGETFTMADIFTGSNQSATVTSPVAATVSTNTSAGNAKDSKLGSDGNYFQIVLSSGTFTAASINGYINTTNTSKNWGFQFSTDGGTSWASEVTQANDGTKSAHDIAVGVTIPSGANGIRVIRRAGTSSYVYSISLTLASTTSYTITYNNNGGSGTMANTTNTVAECTFGAPSATKEFKEWNTAANGSGTAYAAGATATSDLNLYAIWQDKVVKYTVKYFDGATELGSEQVNANGQPANYATYQTKALASFVGWYSDPELNTPAVPASATITAATNFYGKWNKTYAQTIDLAAEAAGDKTAIGTFFSNHGYAATVGGSGGYDTNASGYLGYKFKNNGDEIQFNLQNGKIADLYFMYIETNFKVYVDGVETYTVTNKTTSSTPLVRYIYANGADKFIRIVNNSANSKTSVINKIAIHDPYVVTYDATTNGGTCATASATFTGTTLTLPAATKTSASFIGWFDAASGGTKIGEANANYIPADNVTLYAQFESISTDARLSAITFSSNAGTLSPAFDPEVTNYTYTMPYGTAAVPTITGATSVNANAQAPVIEAQAANWNETAIIRGKAQSGDTKAYNITMKLAPKDGVSLIKVATTGGTNKTVTGVYAGDGDVSLSSSKKMDNGKYIGFILDGTTLQAGDRINVHTTQAANTAGSHIIFYDNMTAKNELYETGEIGGEGDNIFTINAAMVGSATAYVYRANNDAAHQWNGYVDYIEVTRAMNPVLTAITIDGRAGVIDEEHKTVAVQIPHEAVLSSLTVVPTIIRNAAHATTPEAVISNEGAWIEGANTYRVMDKDGDYTDYTITLTRDVLKHTVSFNTHGGSAVASELVVDGESLEAAPAAPEKEDYLFQGWAETDGGAIVDVTTFAISADKEFHAVWAPDGAIKLIEAGAINHTNFITGATMASSQVEVENVNYDYALLGGTASSPSGQNQLNKFIAYNATTTQTKVMVNVYNTATSARQVVIKGVVEGSTTITDIATIDLDNGANKHVKSAYYSFDNAANRTIYISVPNSVNTVDFLQVKVIESGEQLPMFGKSGYSINFNEGRFYGPSATNLEFEGMTYNFGSNYNALSSTAAVFKKNTSYQINVPAAVTMTITASAAKYYVSQATDGTDNETAAEGAHDFDLTAGTWYINVAGSNLSVSSISFAAPKCEKPVFNALDDSELCEGDPYVALDGTGTVTDGGSITYKWYAEGGTDVLGTDATYTPTTDGNYYVVALHHVDGFTDNEATSDVVSVTHFASAAITTAPEDQRVDAGQNATLSVVASGKAPLAYQWYTCDENGDNAEAIDGAESDSYVVAVTAGFSQYYKVIVSSGCGSASAVAKVEEWVELPQLDVTATTTWDWTYAGENNKLVTGKNVEVVMANIKENGKLPTNDATFNSQALLFYGENVRATEGGRNYASVGHIKFNVTVPGRVTVEWSDNGGNSRRLKINDAMDESSTSKTDVRTFSAIVPAGEVTLMGVKSDGTNSNQYIRISKIIFTAEPDHERNVVIGNMGTVCLPNPSRAFGVKVYELAGKGEGCKVQFDELAENEVLEAGKAYVLVMTDTKAKFFYTSNEGVDEPDLTTAMKGNLGETITFQPYAEAARNVVFFKDNAMWNAYETGLKVTQYRAYLQYDEVGVTTASPALGRRRVTLDMHGQNTATGMDELNASETPVKVLINGQIYILRGEQMFDVTGKLVK